MLKPHLQRWKRLYRDHPVYITTACACSGGVPTIARFLRYPTRLPTYARTTNGELAGLLTGLAR